VSDAWQCDWYLTSEEVAILRLPGSAKNFTILDFGVLKGL
jgi:hypothetical protein